jgi:hypothetical protein
MSFSVKLDENVSPSKSPQLEGTLQTPTRAITQILQRNRNLANIGRQRIKTAFLLSSPARRGHQYQMSNIFQTAATSLGASNLESTPCQAACDNHTTCDVEKHDMNPSEILGTIRYPSLPRILALSPPLSKSQLLGSANSTETIRPLPFLKQLGRPGLLRFVDEESGAGIDNPDTPSSSATSASWTGDSQFFVKETLETTTLERHCTIFSWLDLLPTTPDGHYAVEDEPVRTLSPHVTMKRGSTLHERGEKEIRKRCTSFDDDDIFSKAVR